MASPRAHHATVAFVDPPDPRVPGDSPKPLILIAGGENGPNSITNLVELFDPTLQVFQAIDSMNSPRADHSVTLLPDGRVLMTGGRKRTFNSTEFAEDRLPCTAPGTKFECEDVALDDAELFDPDEERVRKCNWKSPWSEPVKMKGSRKQHTVTLFTSDKGSPLRGLVFGGTDSNVIAERFVYQLGACKVSEALTFSEIPSANIPRRREHTATFVAPNRVLIAGGRGDAGPIDTMLLVTLTNDSIAIEEASRLPVGRTGHVALQLSDRRVMIAGGQDASDVVLRDSWLVSAAGEIESGPSMDAPRGHGAFVEQEQSLVVVGGIDAQRAVTDTGSRFDAITQTWTPLARLRTARRDHSLSATVRQFPEPSGPQTKWLLAAGGSDQRGRLLRSAELYFSNQVCQVQGDCSAEYVCSASQWCVLP